MGVTGRTPPEHQTQTPLKRTAAETTLQQWDTPDLSRGISPHSMAQVWEQLFKTTTSVAENLAHRFCKALEENIRQDVWKPRCSALIDWEKQNRVTPTKKRTRPMEDYRRQSAQSWYMRLWSRPNKTRRQDLPGDHGYLNRVRHIFIGFIPRKKETWGDGKTRRVYIFIGA